MDCPVWNYRNSDLSKLLHRTMMRWVANLLAARRRGYNHKVVGKATLVYQAGEDGLRHRGTADVAVADE